MPLRETVIVVRGIRRVLPWLPETDRSKNKRSRPSTTTRGAAVSAAIPPTPKEDEDSDYDAQVAVWGTCRRSPPLPQAARFFFSVGYN